jgi:hypothetical protein
LFALQTNEKKGDTFLENPKTIETQKKEAISLTQYVLLFYNNKET